jgi:hypothetical protein
MDAQTASGLWGGLWKFPIEMYITPKTPLRAIRTQNSGFHFGVAYGNLHKKIEIREKTLFIAMKTRDWGAPFGVAYGNLRKKIDSIIKNTYEYDKNTRLRCTIWHNINRYRQNWGVCHHQDILCTLRLKTRNRAVGETKS